MVKEQKEQEEIRLGGTDPEHEYKVLYIFHFQSGKMTETLYLRQKLNKMLSEYTECKRIINRKLK